MKLKKITKIYELAYSSFDDLCLPCSYIPSNIIEQDKANDKAVYVFYLIADRGKPTEKYSGKIVITKTYKNDPNLARYMTYKRNLCKSFQPKIRLMYEFDLTEIASDVPYDVKTRFVAKTTSTLINRLTSFYFMNYSQNKDEEIRLANEVGYMTDIAPEYAGYDVDAYIADTKPAYSTFRATEQ